MASLPPARDFRGLAVALAMLVGVAFAPTRAAAGCGDYDMPAHPPALEKLLAKPGPEPVKPRCHGPNCSNLPAVPAPLPKTPVPIPAGDDFTSLPSDTPDSAVASRPRPADHADRSPTRVATVIYHPPR